MSKSKIIDFLTRTQKATASLAGAAAAVSAATFVPAPYGGYAAIAGVVLTWVLTYVFPFVSEAVEAFPAPDVVEDPAPGNLEDFDQTSGDVDHSPAESVEPLEGEVLDPEPKTDVIPVQAADETVGIPVIEGDFPTAPFVPPFTGAIRVSDVLDRLAAEGNTVAASHV